MARRPDLDLLKKHTGIKATRMFKQLLWVFGIKAFGDKLKELSCSKNRMLLMNLSDWEDRYLDPELQIRKFVASNTNKYTCMYVNKNMYEHDYDHVKKTMLRCCCFPTRSKH